MFEHLIGFFIVIGLLCFGTVAVGVSIAITLSLSLKIAEWIESL